MSNKISNDRINKVIANMSDAEIEDFSKLGIALSQLSCDSFAEGFKTALKAIFGTAAVGVGIGFAWGNRGKITSGFNSLKAKFKKKETVVEETQDEIIDPEVDYD